MRPRQHLRRILEQPRHLVGALHKKLVAVKPEPLLVVHLRARLHAQHHVVRVRVLAAQVMRVVGRHQRNVQLPLQPEQRLVNLLLVLQPLVLNFEKEIALAENILVLLRHAPRLLIPPGHQFLAQLPAQAAGKPDQPLRMFGEIALADARLAIEPVQRGLRGNPDQVPVALFVLGQHQQVVVVVALARRAVVLVLRDIKLAAQNRLDPLGLRRIEEVHRAVDIAVVGHGDRLLAERGDAVHELVDVASAVQQRVLGVQMQVREFGHDYLRF